MSVTIDASILVYAADPSSRFNEGASVALAGLMEGREIVHLFWPALLAYLRIVTHPRLSEHPLSMDEATANVSLLLDRSIVRVSGEPDGMWSGLRKELLDGQARGKLVHDAHVVALMRAHGVRDIVTHDRDFRRFPGIRVIDPFEAHDE